MKRKVQYILIALLAVSCSGKKSGMSNDSFGDSVNDSSKTLKYAQYFSFQKFTKGTLVYLIDPANKNDTVQTLFLGKQIQKGLDPEIQFIKTPIQNVGCLSSVFVAYAESLGKAANITAVDEFDYICSGNVRARIDLKKVEELSSGNSFNFEKAVKLNPEALLIYSVPGAEDPAISKMKELGLKVVLCQNYLEQHPLGRAEWIKFFGLLFDEEKKAYEIFNEVEEHYNTYAQTAMEQKNKPSVFMYAPYNNSWNISGGKSFASQLLSDAGSIYCWADDTGTANKTLPFEAVYSKISKADFWLIPNEIKSMNELINSDPRYKLFNSVSNKQVYNCDKWNNNKGGNMFWEYGVVRPDLILADMLKIFHPELMQDHTFVFFRKLQ